MQGWCTARGWRSASHTPRARTSKLYHEADFPLILTALVHHIEAVQSKAAA